MSNTLNKLAAVAILAFVVAIAWLVVLEPYAELWQDKIAKAERFQRKLDALQQLLRDREQHEQQYQAISTSETLQALFLDDNNGALADAKLLRIVKQTVSDSGGEILQAVITRTKPPNSKKNSTESEPEKSVTVKVLMQGSIASIYTMLQNLESNRPLIVVKNLQIEHIKSRYPVSLEVSATSYRASYDAVAFIL